MDAKLNIGSVTMPSGEYFVGDPCYTVPDDSWIPWLEAADYMSNRRYLLAEIDGKPVLGIGTYGGDGTYRGSDGNEYPVDAGLIGLVPVSVSDQKNPTGVTRVTFDKLFTCDYEEDGGVIRLGHITIETDPDEDESDGW